MSEDQVRKRLASIAASMGGQRILAQQLDMSETYLSDVLRGRRGPNPKILAFLKLRKRVDYVEIE